MSYYSQYAPIAINAAQQYGIPQNIFLWQIGQESGWNPNAQNGQAIGIAQIMPQTAQSLGVNPSNPIQSIYGAAQYDAQLYNQSGNWQSALTSYGTLANVPQSVITGFNNAANSSGISTANNANLGLLNTSQPWSATNGIPQQKCSWYDIPCLLNQYALRTTIGILGLLFIIGGIILLGKGPALNLAIKTLAAGA